MRMQTFEGGGQATERAGCDGGNQLGVHLDGAVTEVAGSGITGHKQLDPVADLVEEERTLGPLGF